MLGLCIVYIIQSLLWLIKIYFVAHSTLVCSLVSEIVPMGDPVCHGSRTQLMRRLIETESRRIQFYECV